MPDPAPGAAGARTIAGMTTILLYPGLAADERLFTPMRQPLPGLQVPRFITPERGESLENYARRLAPTLAPLVPSGHAPWYLGGFSFGSQLAQEMVAHLKASGIRAPAGLILICGVRGRHQILPSFVRQQKLGALVPGWIARRIYGPYARHFAKQCGLDAVQTELLVSMARDNDPDFLRWSAKACAQWKGTPRLNGLPVLHIHGERDQVIPDPRREADVTLPGAGHLITLTHAPAVIEAMRRFIEETSRTI